MIPQRKIVSDAGKMALQPHLPPPPTVSPPPPTVSTQDQLHLRAKSLLQKLFQMIQDTVLIFFYFDVISKIRPLEKKNTYFWGETVGGGGELIAEGGVKLKWSWRPKIYKKLAGFHHLITLSTLEFHSEKKICEKKFQTYPKPITKTNIKATGKRGGDNSRRRWDSKRRR